jgi:hypothetical protein
MWRYAVAWLPMIGIAIANGALREWWLLPRYGDDRAHQISTLLLLALFTLYIGPVMRAWPPRSASQAWAVGGMWLVLTLAFEFSLGLYGGLTGPEMLYDYNLFAGRLWILVPLWLALAPWVLSRTAARRR